jgi:hypothetical protein
MTRHNADIIESIRQEFVQGILDDNGMRSYPTIDELSKKHSIPSITLYRKSQGESWKQQKIDFQETLRLEIDNQKRKKIAKDSIEFDENNLRLAKALQNEIVALISLSNKKRTEGDSRPFFSPSSLNSLGMALMTCQKVGRLALGESTDNTNITTTESTVNEAFKLIEEMFRGKPKESDSQLH